MQFLCCIAAIYVAYLHVRQALLLCFPAGPGTVEIIAGGRNLIGILRFLFLCLLESGGSGRSFTRARNSGIHCRLPASSRHVDHTQDHDEQKGPQTNRRILGQTESAQRFIDLIRHIFPVALQKAGIFDPLFPALPACMFRLLRESLLNTSAGLLFDPF